MHARPKLRGLGRGVSYIVIAAMLLPLLLSATAPQAAASPGKNWETPSDASASSENENLAGNLAGYVLREHSGGITDEANFYDWDNATSGYATASYSADENREVIAWDLGTSENYTIHFKHQAGDGPNPFTSYIETSADDVTWNTENIAAAGTTQTGDFTATFRYLRWRVLAPPAGGSGANGLLYTMEGTLGASNTRDDDTTTKWRPDPENESGAWINWDLGTIKGVSGGRIYWDADSAYRPTAYHIQTSTDNSSWTTVVTETSAAPASAWKEYSWAENSARYIKLVVDTHGSSGTEIFEMDAGVGYPLTIESITVNNSLIDRDVDYSGSGAIESTTITIRVQDNDGYGEVSAVYISIRDNNDGVVVDNVQVTDNTVINENTLDFTYVYNPADNLPNDNLGAFDVNVVVEDNWGASDNNDWGGDGADLFTVDDLSTTINFDPTSPHVGWDLTVSGTHSRVVGSVSIDGSWLIDNKHGQFALGASNTYNQTYTISNATENENVGVTLRALDSPLDGATTSSYKVNENIKFQVWVRFEENYGVVGWIPDENRGIDLLFEWDGGTYPYTLTANPENITVPSGGVSINTVKLTDNDDYWRYFIPLYSGGNLNFIIVEDISDVEQYRFYLQDYTALYMPPDGQMLVKFWIGTNLAEINGDYWGADWRTTAWLVTGTQYQIWVRGLNAPLRLVGPIDAVNPTDEKTIVVQVVVENVAPIFDDVYWNAWRVDNSTIRVEYRDNLDNTIEAHVAINDENGVMQIEYQPDNEWFITTWISAEGAESYEVVLTVQHGVYGDFVMTMPIGTLGGPPGVEGGVSEPWGLPGGLTLSALGSVILVLIVGLSFDAPRVQMGMLAMALTTIFCWQMGFLPLPGPYGGSFTAVLILVMAVLFALTWRRGK